MKEYIRLDQTGSIFYWFTDESISPIEGDIRVDNQSCYKNWLNARDDYCLRGVPQYKYLDGEIIKKTDEEIEEWKPESTPSLEDQLREYQRVMNIFMGVESYD